MTLLEVQTYLASLGLGTANVDLFRDYMPVTPNSCIVVKAYGGRMAADIWRFGEPHVAREYPRIQLLVRGEPEDYATPEQKAHDAYRLLSQSAPVILSGTQYWTITPLQPPFPLEKDGLQRYVFACNFELFKEVTA